MKALSVRQPWASLIASGDKWIETRSWRTHYRGPLAIHAAKSWSADEMRFAMQLINEGTLRFEHLRDVPRGVVVATVELVDVVPTDDVAVHARQRRFGDFTPGRFAWVLSDRVALTTPEPARGGLGLWSWGPA